MPIASAGPKGVSNQPQAIVQPLAGAGVFARAHRLPAQEEVVQPPGAGEAGGVGGVEHGVPLGEQPLGVVERQILLVALGADADPLAEHALEVRRAEPDAGGDLVERGLLGRAGDDRSMARPITA